MARLAFGSPRSPLQLRWASGRRHFATPGGVPKLIFGQAAWMLTQNLTGGEVDDFLDDQQARGVTDLMIDPIGKHWSINSPNNLADVSPFTGTTGGQEDLSTPRAAFWDAVLDIVGTKMASRGLRAMFAPSYLGNAGVDGWYDEFSANSQAKCEAYGQFIGEEFGTLPNVIHLVGGDRAWANIGSGERTKLEAYAAALQTADPVHLVSAHFLGGDMNWEHTSGKWLDWHFTYSVAADMVADSLGGYNFSGTAPVIMGESTYVEGPFDGAAPTRKKLRGIYWQAMLSGCVGFLHGDENVWPFGGPNGFAGTDWEGNLDTDFMHDAQRVRDFFEARDWWKLVPEPTSGSTLVTSGRGSVGASFVAAARAYDGSFAAIDVRGGGEIGVDCDVLAGPVTAQWYDVTTGLYSSAGSGLTGSQSFDPTVNAAGDTDKVLLLVAA